MNDSLPFVALGVLFVRPGILVIATPIFGGNFVPAPVRVALTVMLGVLLFPLVPVPRDFSTASLTMALAGEAIVGTALALSIRALVAGAEFAGYLAGFQIGLSYASIVDPGSGSRSNAIAVLYSSLATVAFLGVNGHHALLRALVRSYDKLPIGSWQMEQGMFTAVTRMLGMVFLMGAQLAMPIVIVLLLVEVVLGLASRVAPALNIMTLGFPVRIAAGFLALAVAVQVVPGAVARYAPAAIDAASRLVWSR